MTGDALGQGVAQRDRTSTPPDFLNEERRESFA